MGEGRHPLSMTSRASILGLSEMPPLNKTDFTGFKSRRFGASAFEDKRAGNPAISGNPGNFRDSSFYVPSNPEVTPTPPLYSSPWLNEVARMNPLRQMEHSSYPSTSSQPIPEYYQHYPTIHPRTTFYSNVFPGSHCQQYVRDYSHLVPRAHTSVTTSLVRPIAPLIPSASIDPLRVTNSRSLLTPRERNDLAFSLRAPTPLRSSSRPEFSSTEPSCESPTPKRRALSATLGAGPSGTVSPVGPSVAGTASPVDPVRRSPVQVGSSKSSTVLTSPVPSKEDQDRGSSPSDFLSHFQKGSLVNLVQGVRRVEELQTKDFVEAARAANDVSLDPSTVVSITSVEEKQTSVIAFSFSSREKEISVEVSNDHPFFVFHRGWSSCSPEMSLNKYNLTVRKLQVGDVCVSLKRSEEENVTNSDDTPDTPPLHINVTKEESTKEPSSSSTGEDGRNNEITDMPPPKSAPKYGSTSQRSHGSISPQTVPTLKASGSGMTPRSNSTSPNFASVPSLVGKVEDNFEESPCDLSKREKKNTNSSNLSKPSSNTSSSSDKSSIISEKSSHSTENISNSSRKSPNLTEKSSNSTEKIQNSDTKQNPKPQWKRKRRWSDPYR